MLGAVGLRHGGGRIDPVQAPRPRLILAMLGARTGRPVLEDQLIDGIWGQAPPSSARTAVQTYLSALRDLLEPDRPRRSPGRFIATDGGGYVLDPTAAQVDLVQFEHEVSSGIRQASDDPVAAVELLDRALARWGEPFSELNSEPWAAGVARGCENAIRTLSKHASGWHSHSARKVSSSRISATPSSSTRIESGSQGS